MARFLSPTGIFLLAGILTPVFWANAAHHRDAGHVRQYYIAADELDWDYMPSGRDAMMPGMPPRGYARFYAQRGPHLIGKLYRKAVYREYTDATFRRLKPRPPEEAYPGLLGPIPRAEVGDPLKILY